MILSELYTDFLKLNLQLLPIPLNILSSPPRFFVAPVLNINYLHAYDLMTL